MTKINHAKIAAAMHETADLVHALAEFPRIRAELAKPPKNGYDATKLELSASEMADGEGQGSNAYCYLPAALAEPILEEAEKVIRDELKARGVRL